MNQKPKTHTTRAIFMAALVALGTTFGATPAFAQSSADIEALRAEIKASREAYEARIAELEKRLAAVEKAPARTTSTTIVPASPDGSPGVVILNDGNANLEQRVAALEQGQQATSQSLAEVKSPKFFEDMLPKDLTRGLELHGYLRAGYGINNHGGGQDKITSPDGLFDIGPGRLGDEPDTYGELTFKYTAPQASENDIKIGVQTTLAFKYRGDKNNYANQDSNGVDLLFREAFVTASNVFKNNPDVQFWVGQRFYDRHDIHIYDYYFLDTSGYGGGVENIKLGPGKFAAAYIGGTDNTAQVESEYSLTKQILDFRWSDLPSLFDGKGTLWVSPQYVNGGSGVNPNSTAGIALGWLQQNNLSKGYNKLSLQYGWGAGYQFGTYVSSVSWQDKGALRDAQTAQITNQLVWQFDDQFSLMWAAIANWEDRGFTQAGGSGSDRLFLTTAVRPIYMFTQHLGLETEFGIDWASDNRSTSGKDQTAMAKLTVAGVIKPSGAFWSRPEIRAYASYYYWGNSMPDDFSPNGERDGAKGTWTFGVQAETWW